MYRIAFPLLAAFSILANASIPGHQLGFDVAQKVAALDYKASKVQNSLTSPLSLQLALSMAANGASTHSLNLLLSKLGATDRASLNAANATLQRLLRKSGAPENWPRWRAKPPVLSISNSAWRTNGATDKRNFVFSEDFKTDLKSYDAEIGVGDFKTKMAVDAINGWVTKATNNMITEIIDLDGLNPLLWALINAVYLEGQWSKPFIPLTTRGPNFTKLDGTGIEVSMMTKQDSYRHVMTSHGEAIELPLAESDLAFVALLPDEKSDFVKLRGEATRVWDQSLWSDVLERLANSEKEYGTLEIPKFKYTYGYEMTPDAELTDMLGLKPLFSNDSDFSRMGTRASLQSKVALIIQKTAIELDEKGLKAAAVTLVGGAERTSLPPRPTFHMQINRPFVYTIVDRKSGAILFLGSVVDPTK